MPAHNVLELLLTYSIPRRDVKPNAYSLLNKFDGKLENVFAAEFDELKSADGTGESSAALIKLYSEVFRRLDGGGSCVKLDNYVDKKDFVTDILNEFEGECYTVLFVNNSGDITSYMTFPQNDDAAPPSVKSVVEGVIKNNAAGFIIAHKKVGEKYKPDETDFSFIKELSRVFSDLKIKLDDYITVSEGGSLSMSNDIRYFMYLN